MNTMYTFRGSNYTFPSLPLLSIGVWVGGWEEVVVSTLSDKNLLLEEKNSFLLEGTQYFRRASLCREASRNSENLKLVLFCTNEK